MKLLAKLLAKCTCASGTFRSTVQHFSHKATTNYTLIFSGSGTHSLNLDKSDIEDERGVGRDELAHTPLAIAEMRRDCDPASLPEAHVHESTVHSCDDTTMTD